ncbi:MAG: hypothetical protein ACXVZV_06385 [Terriglobales bacterium]
MKMVRTLGLVTLLLALGATQIALAQSNTSSDQAQQQQNPNQPPPSPLQDQPTGIAAEQKAQQDQQKTGQLSTFETPTTTQQDQALGEIRLMSRYTEVGGDRTRSFRDPGMNDVAEFNYFMDRRFMVTHRMQTLTMFRATDDYSIDPEKDSMQKGFVRIYSPRDEYIFGDALVNYSRLTFNQNIKGGSASWLMGNHWKMSMIGGIFVDRWGSLYKDLPGRPYMAAVGGARLAYSFSREFVVGWNFSQSNDVLSTLPYAPVGTTPFPAANTVGSMDFKFQKRNFRMEGEFAYSASNFDHRDDSNICTSVDSNNNPILVPCDTRQPQPNAGTQGDWGARLEASYRHSRFNFRGSFVRFQPNFASMNARQISDLNDILARPGVDVTDWLSVDGTMRYSSNDLKSQLPYRTTLWGPEGRLLFHDLSFFRRAVLEMGYRDRIVGSDNYTADPAQTGTVDRFVRGPYAELTLPVRTTFLTVGWERRNAVDHVNPGQSSNTNRFYAGLRGVYDWGGWHINPAVRWEVERQGSRPDLDLTPPDPRFDLDSNRLDTINLLIEAPKWFIIEGGFRDASATIYGPSGYSRPAYRAQITYKIRNDENILLVFSFERSNNYYFTSPNFDERVSGVSFIYKFGKRGR